MKKGWETKPFEDCIEAVKYTRKIQRKDFLDDGQFPIVSQEAEFTNGYWDDEADVFKISSPVVVFGDHTQVLKYVDFDFVLGADGVKILPPRDFLCSKFFFYQLQAANFTSLGYARHYRLLKELEIKYPPLPEQQRIVGLLDEAFEGLATAKANAEKNLQNARALFESHLNAVLTRRGKGWVEKRFDEMCILQRGFDLPTHSRNSGKYPLVSSNGITDRIDRWKIHGPGVVTGRSGTIGKVHFVDEDFWPLNTALYVKEFHGNNERFVYYFLMQYDLGKYSSGAGVPTLNRNNIHGEKVVIPTSLEEQKEIVLILDSLTAETHRLARLYERKLAALEALKKSLLHQAFSGGL